MFFSHTVSNSPALIKSHRIDSIGIRQRLRAIAKTLIENYRKWEAGHRRGITLCKAIEKCKSHAINTFNDSDNADTGTSDRTLYPAELKPFCDKLKVITTIFDDVLTSAKESKRQIDSFIKLGEPNVFGECQLVFRTWKCETLQKNINKICESYENEYRVKMRVMENIAHARYNEDLLMHVAVWEYQKHVNADLHIIFKGFAIEADVDVDDKL